MNGEADLDIRVVLDNAEKPSPAPPPKDFGDQYRASIDRYREAAKWAVGAFAGIGALLVAALPLAQLGAGTASDPAQTFWGAVLALGGVTLAIAAMLSVLAPRSVFSFELRATEHGAVGRFLSGTWAMEHMLHEHGGTLLPRGIDDMPGLTRGIANLDQVIRDAERTSPPGDSAAVDALVARQAEMVETMQRLTWVARIEKMRAAFHVSSVVILVAGLAVGAGIGLLFDALYDDTTSTKTDAEIAKLEAETDKLDAEAAKVRADTPDVEDESADADDGEQAVPAPAVDVLLTDEGRALVPDCAATPGESLSGVVLGGSRSAGWDVVVLPTSTCAGGQLTLTPELGTLR